MVLRVVAPETPAERTLGRYVHCDYTGSGVQDMLTAWLPLADVRWQRPDRPAPAETILGPAGRPPKLFSRLLRREPWWAPVPSGLELRPGSELAARAAGPSEFFAVDPAWRRPRPGQGRFR